MDLKERDIIRIVKPLIDSKLVEEAAFIQSVLSHSKNDPEIILSLTKLLTEIAGKVKYEPGWTPYYVVNFCVSEESSFEFLHFAAKICEFYLVHDRAYALLLKAWQKGNRTLLTIVKLGQLAAKLSNREDLKRWISEASRIYEELCVNDCINDAIAVESQIYNSLIKQIEEDDFVADSMEALSPHTYAASKKIGVAGGNVAPLTKQIDPETIGFIFPRGALLAHTKVVLSMMQGLQRLSSRKMIPVVLVLGGDCPTEFSKAFRELNVKTIHIPRIYSSRDGSDFAAHIAEVRATVGSLGIRTVVWISVPCTAGWYFGARIAQRQIYWTMKFHSQFSPEIDLYVSCGSIWEKQKMVRGRKWLTGPVSFEDALSGGNASEAIAIRNSFAPGTTILGVLARTEKIFSVPYLAAVAEILDQNKECIFLWTGRDEHSGVKGFFSERGLADRAIFIGWVNTATYAQVLDIFLETFPFGCGMTAAQSLAATVPVISYNHWSTIYGAHAAPLLNREVGSDADREDLRNLFFPSDKQNLLSIADDSDKYIALANSLIRDDRFRKRVANAGNSFYVKYLGNSKYSAERFSRIFTEKQ